MKAEYGKRYAQIVDGQVHWCFTASELPEWKDGAFIVEDVTDMPEVDVGHIYNGPGLFLEPRKGPLLSDPKMVARGLLLVACEELEADTLATPATRAFAEKVRMFLAHT